MSGHNTEAIRSILNGSIVIANTATTGVKIFLIRLFWWRRWRSILDKLRTLPSSANITLCWTDFHFFDEFAAAVNFKSYSFINQSYQQKWQNVGEKCQ